MGRSQLNRTGLLLGAVLAALLLASGVLAYYLASSAPGGHGAAAATTVSGGSTPTASLTSGRAVTVSWGATTLANGQPVSGYLVRRYDATTHISQLVLADCAGEVTGSGPTVSCVEHGVPVGAWQYTVTPLVGDNWQGAESAYSGTVTVGAATLTLANTLFGAPLPAVTAGSVAGFADGEGLTFSLDDPNGPALTSSPASVDANGAASVNVTIPSTGDGSHTVYARGDATPYPSQASTGIVVDQTAPQTSASLSPSANAAGWTNASTTVTLSAADATSGVKQITYSAAGAQPVSQTTVSGASAQLTISTEGTTTISFYATDNAGNVEATETQVVKLDETKPLNALALTAQSGGGSYLDGATVYYQGSQSGSFSLSNDLSDTLSGPASSSTSALSGVTVGWHHTSSTVTSGPPYVSNAFSWDAATTSSPQETVTGADVADNQQADTLTFVPDTNGPTGGALTADGTTATSSGATVYDSTGSFSLTRTDYATDDLSGLDSSTLTVASATLSSSDGVAEGSCGSFGAETTVSGAPAQSGLTTGCYRYTLTGVDNVGNQSQISVTVKVDTTGPTAPSLTLTASGPWESAGTYGGTTALYFNPAHSGSFDVTATTTDADSGIKDVTFPALSGMTGGGADSASPFTTTYSWDSSSTLTGGSIVSRDYAGGTNSKSLLAIADTQGPGGGSIGVSGGATMINWSSSDIFSRSGSYSLNRTDYSTDDLSGLDSSTLTVATATLSSSNGSSEGSCGSFGAETTIVGAPSQTVTGPYCYRYTLTGTDNVGNQSQTSVTVKVDTTAPTAPTDATLTPETGLAYQYVSGKTLYYNPAQAGSFQFSTTASDPDSGIVGASLTVPNGFSLSSPPSRSGTSFTWAYSWNDNVASPSPGAQTIPATNYALNTTYNSDAFTLTKDASAPTGGALTIDGTDAIASGATVYDADGVYTIARTDYSGDTGSGVASSTLTVAQAPLSSSDGVQDGACGTFGPETTIVGAPPQANSGPTCYRYTLTGADNVDNQAQISVTVKVDTTGPSTPQTTVSNATGNTYVDGQNVYINPQGGRFGSFDVAATSTDNDSGIAKVTFPTLSGFTAGGGDDTSSPYSTHYSWSGASATASGLQTVSATDNAGNSSSDATAFTVTPDTTNPTAPTPTVNPGYYTTLSVPVAYTQPTDAGSGVATVDVQRLVATLSNGSCGSFSGSWQTITLSGGADTTVQSGHCYTYRLAVTDNVGNNGVSTFASSIAKVDTSAPSTPSLSFGAFSNVYWPGTGNIVYYRPAAANGGFTVTASGGADAESGFSFYTFPTFPSGWLTTPSSSSASYSWITANPTQPSGNQAVTATNHAGLVSSGSNSTNPFLMVVDAAAPSTTTPSVTAGYYQTLSVPVGVTAASDSSSGLASSTLQRDQAPLANGACGTFPGSWSTVTLSGGNDTTVQSGFCYVYRQTATDNVGNVGNSGSSNVAQVDATAPSGSVTAPASSSTVGGLVTVSSNSADGGSGVANADFQYTTHGGSSWTDLGSDTSSPYSVSWDTTTVANGSYDLRVVTTDQAGNQTTSAPVTVTVSNTLDVSATSPQTAGSAFTVTLTAKAAGATNNDYNAQNVAVTFAGPGAAPDGTDSPSYPATVNFTAGVATASVTLYKAETATLTASAGNLATGNGQSITVNGAATPASVAMTSCSPAGGTNCSGPFSLGNSPGHLTGSFTAYDAYGNTAQVTSTYTISLSLAATTNYTFGNSGSVGSSSVTISSGSGTSGSFTVTHKNNGSNSTTLTASGSGVSSVNYTVQK